MLTNNTLRSVRFVLRPSCEHFFEMTKMLHNNDKKWDKVMGWGHELPYWLSASDKKMRVSPEESGAGQSSYESVKLHWQPCQC